MGSLIAMHQFICQAIISHFRIYTRNAENNRRSYDGLINLSNLK